MVYYQYYCRIQARYRHPISNRYLEYKTHHHTRANTGTRPKTTPAATTKGQDSGALLQSTEADILDETFMNMALEQAQEAFSKGEVPVGAVLVAPSGRVISASHNTTETDHDPTCHAEMSCIRKACAESQGWRLLDCTLYVTLEPCPMCAGAILQSRVGTVVYGASNPLLGADGSWIRMFPLDGHVDGRNPHPFHPDIVVRRGVCAEACASIMQKFFRMRRQ